MTFAVAAEVLMLRAPRFVLWAVVIFSFASGVAAQVPADLRQDAHRISGPILLVSQAMDSLEDLTDTIGPRLAGSSAYNRAAQWAAEKMDSLEDLTDTGVVMVLEAARAIAALGKRPRRSIRFALFGAEEPGPSGSRAYIQAHAAELPNCVAVLNTDDGAARAYGWRVFRPDLRKSMEPISNALLKDLGGDQLTEEVVFAGDDESFFLQGVPTLSLWTDTSHYSDFAHKQGDTFDKVDPVYFKTDAAVMAVTAYALAQTPTAIGPHLKHDEVGSILRNADLEKYLIELGFWNP